MATNCILHRRPNRVTFSFHMDTRRRRGMKGTTDKITRHQQPTRPTSYRRREERKNHQRGELFPVSSEITARRTRETILDHGQMKGDRIVAI
ncbi:unnamed protein product [Linum trigynum]|uniref:Uncharacterized protein n=1 Tax=Linum trigynum TaxID=586398 RepID=A0AAV2D5C7_9ROSI